MTARVPRIGFVVEQALGHATHADNLARFVADDPRILAEFAPIPYDPDPRFERIPGYGNWTVRAGLRARRAVRRLGKSGRLDALFIHTQVPATLMPGVLKRIPSVVSLDATPLQYDRLGATYDHAPGSDRVEAVKRRFHDTMFARARHLVTWSHWVKHSLVDDYGVAPERITVIPPGVDYARWAAPPREVAELGATTRVLFVGGNLERKGGLILLDAIRRLRADGVPIEVDLVTRDDVPAEPGVAVYHGVTANSPELISLFHRADVFCLPTYADMLAIVLSEAGAAGLPLVASDVGGLGELVEPEVTGLVVPPGDTDALAGALRRLAEQPQLRTSLGARAQQEVRERFDAEANAHRLVGLLADVAEGRT